MAPMKYVGVDGCKGGWFSVGFDSNGEYESEVFKTFNELLDHYKESELILVDIPIGLPEDKKGRDCDSVARKKLISRRSTVFTTPTRQTAYQVSKSQNDYVSAAICELVCTGKRSISKQVFNIAAKIAEVDKAIRERECNENPKVREIHPEICFWALNNEKPITSKKQEQKGWDERLKVLKCVTPRDGTMQKIFDEACKSGDVSQGIFAKDDILDALVAAVTAYKGSQLHQRLQTLPEKPKKDSKKLPMEMVYWIPS